MIPATKTRPHFVYRYFAADGTLLYIGCTHRLKERTKTHSKKEWFPTVSWSTHEAYPDHFTAKLAERAAIMVNQPLHNRQLNDWLPTDPQMARQLHALATNPPADAARILVDIERRVFEQEKADKLREMTTRQQKRASNPFTGYTAPARSGIGTSRHLAG